ncbi:MAG TPA: hypothetical protein VF637_10825 [Sphingomicrobium sp.]
MRRIIFAAVLLVAGCATPPAPQPQPQPTRPVQPTPSVHVRTDVLGMDASELVRTFGSPALQVREGVGLKMQWRGIACVLDAYLYPPAQGSGLPRVTHADARLPSGADASQPSCIAALQAR